MSCSPCNQTNQEDLYLLHFAGKEGGKSPIGPSENKNALKAQKHLISNTISALATGLLCGFPLGFKAAALLNERRNFFSIFDCGICEIGFALLQNEIPEFLVRNSFIGGKITTDQCYDTYEGTFKCRFVYFVAKTFEEALYVDSNKLAALTATFALGIGCFSLMYYKNAEIKRENKLIATFESRYQKAADRLTDKVSEASGDKQKEQEVQELSKGIIARQDAIQQELTNLKLPNLTVDKIKNISRPMFDAAIKIQKDAADKLAVKLFKASGDKQNEQKVQEMQVSA